MKLPSNSEYKEAIQHPHDCFADGDLRSCNPYPGRHGLPWHATGNFAAVFRLRSSKCSKQWAVKCFTHDVSADRGVRYSQIQSHFGNNRVVRACRLRELVDFAYVDRGICVRGSWQPIIKMEYVAADDLLVFVERHLGDRQALTAVAARWLELSIALRKAGVAHGDLQHANVKVLKDTSGLYSLKLLDYDGMYIPSLAAHPPGECGHENYQHPSRLKGGAYNAEIDRFPNLVIYTTLRCLALDVGKELWAEFNNGENLLFRRTDFQPPGDSPLFKKLLQHGGPVRPLVARLALASQGTLERVPLLEEILYLGRPVDLTAAEQRRLEALIPNTKKHSTPPPQGKPWWAGRTPSAPPSVTHAAPVSPAQQPVTASGNQAPQSIPRKPSWASRLFEYLRNVDFEPVLYVLAIILGIILLPILAVVALAVAVAGGVLFAVLLVVCGVLWVICELWPLWLLLAVVYWFLH